MAGSSPKARSPCNSVKIGKKQADEIQRIGALRMAGNLGARCQALMCV